MVREETFGTYGLFKNGISTRFALFPTMRQVGDVRMAKGELQKLRKNELKLGHIEKTKGSMKEYFNNHKEGLKHAEKCVEHLYDEIKFNIYDLQVLKHTIREMYQDDKGLIKKGLPPKIGRDLEKGIMHTQEEINNMLREISDMLGQLTKQN